MLNVSMALRLYREMYNKSKEDLAKYLEIQPKAYARYESGEREPSLEKLYKLAYLYNCKVDDFINALYFKKQIEKNFFEENETYFRIVYLWAEGLLDSKQGRVEEGQRKMEDALRIFEMIGCSKSADFYRSAMEC